MEVKSVIEILGKMEGMCKRFEKGSRLKVGGKGLTPGEARICLEAINRQIKKLRNEILSKRKGV